MKPRELENMGIPRGRTMKLAVAAIKEAAGQWGMKKAAVRQSIEQVIADPELYVKDQLFGTLAQALITERGKPGTGTPSVPVPGFPSAHPDSPTAPWRQWGTNIEAGAIQQMENACSLPVTLRGALMPDAHQGYGLPIGGVVATQGSVIPFGVGVDIGCRMKLTVLDLPLDHLDRHQNRLIEAIEQETRFGVGSEFGSRQRSHRVMDDDWSVTGITRQLKDKAQLQLGTSGSGNHFVEFGVFTLDHADLGLAPGAYLALLSHSGSRGTGAEICEHFSRIAMKLHPELPRELSHLAWLDLDSDEGEQYWEAMQLMGHYSSANHELIHRHVARHLGAGVLLDVENHHNFAWKETHFGHEVVVHRKGATPAHTGMVGIIPGSMASPAFVVRGKGQPESLDSAAHGAGRRMSRTAAFEKLSWQQLKERLAERGVTLISASLDESPFAYKDIEEVMAAQSDLVEMIARFDPKLVKMAAKEGHGRRGRHHEG